MNTNTTLSTSQPENQFASAKEFASWMSKRIGRSWVMKLNKHSGTYRRDTVLWYITMYSKDEIAFEYDNAAYGLKWALDSGRCNGMTVLAIRAMNVRQLCMLVHELMANCENMGEYARYLMLKQQAGKL